MGILDLYYFHIILDFIHYVYKLFDIYKNTVSTMPL